jgi:osmotically inducible protein OsmC
MTQAQTLYTGKVHVTGGRDGSARSDDGRLDIKLSTPGGPGAGTNPEQLLAAGWSACFQGAMAIAAKQMDLKLGDVAIDAEIDLNLADGGFSSARA